MKKFSLFLVFVLSFGLLGNVAAETIKLIYGNPSSNGGELIIQDGKVTGGFSQGTLYWDIYGGAYNGSELVVTFVTTQ